MLPSAVESFSEKTLAIDLARSDQQITVVWRGQSNERDPSVFLAPILARALADADAGRRLVVVDFRAVEYMNSSTFTPVVRMLERARKEGHRVQVWFRTDVRWQTLSFGALKAFETPDGRIALKGHGGPA